MSKNEAARKLMAENLPDGPKSVRTALRWNDEGRTSKPPLGRPPAATGSPGGWSLRRSLGKEVEGLQLKASKRRELAEKFKVSERLIKYRLTQWRREARKSAEK